MQRFIIFPILLTMISLGFLYYSIPQIPENTSLAQLFPENSEIAQKFEDFSQAFGTNDILLVSVFDSSENPIFREEVLDAIDHITRELEPLEELESVVSITNLQDLKLKKIIFTEKYAPLPGKYLEKPYKLTEARVQELRQDAFLKTGLLSQDNRTIAIWVLLKPHIKTQPDFLAKISHITEKVPAVNIPGVTVRVTGFPILQSLTQNLLRRDAVVFFISSILVAIVIALFSRVCYRVLVSLLLSIPVVAAIWLGYHYFSGNPLHFFSNIIFVFFFIVAVPTLLHMERAWRKRQDVKITWKICSFAVLTTAIGFATLLVSDLSPLRSLGTEIPIVLISGFIVPNLFLYLQHKFLPPLHDREFALPSKFVAVLGVISVVFVVLWGFLPRQKTMANFLEYLPKNHPYIQDTQFVMEAFQAQTPFEIIVALPQQSAHQQLLNPETYKIMENFQKDILQEANGEIIQILSPVTVVATINMKLAKAQKGQATEADFRVTPQATDIAIFWFIKPFLSFFAQGQQAEAGLLKSYQDYMRQLFSKNGTHIRFGSRLPNLEPQKVLDLQQRLEKKVFPKYRTLLKTPNIYTTGFSVLISQTAQEISKTQQQSLMLSIATISLLLLVMVRSFKLWLLSIITNACTFLSFYSVMQLLQIPLDMYMIILIVAVLGIMVDGTFHLLLYYNYCRRNNIAAPLEYTISKVRPAIVISSLMLIAGFSVFLFSAMPTYTRFSLLAQISIAFALFWDAWALPAVIAKVQKYSD